MRIFDFIPGFRSRRPWKMLIAIIYYFVAIFFGIMDEWGISLIFIAAPFFIFSIIDLILYRRRGGFLSKFLITLILSIVVMGIGTRIDPDAKVSSGVYDSDSLEGKVAKVINKQFGETLKYPDEDKERIIKIRTVDYALTSREDDKIVYIELNADIPTTESSIKRERLNNSAIILKKLFKEISEAAEIDLTWYDTYYDENNKEYDDATMRINVDRRGNERIDWSDYESMLQYARDFWQNDYLKDMEY